MRRGSFDSTKRSERSSMRRGHGTRGRARRSSERTTALPNELMLRKAPTATQRTSFASSLESSSAIGSRRCATTKPSRRRSAKTRRPRVPQERRRDDEGHDIDGAETLAKPRGARRRADESNALPGRDAPPRTGPRVAPLDQGL